MLHPYTTISMNDVIDQLPEAERTRLRSGEAVITGADGQYTGWILTTADVETVWSVLTDYENFSEFLPSVSESEVVDEEGDRKIVEQVDSRRVLLMEVDSTVRTENIEDPPERIDFRLVSGDLEKLNGQWKIYALDGEEDAWQVLITQQVEADASAGLFEGVFHSVFEQSLKNNLNAIQQESERRKSR